MNPLTITQLSLPADPAPRPHAIIRMIPVWGDEDARFLALCHASREGLTEPVKMTDKREIIDPDSRERWLAAKRWQLTEIPVQYVEEGEVATTCLQTLALRRHYTKGALAYIAFPLLETALTESNARRIKNLKNPNVSPKVTQLLSVKNTEELAAELGFTRPLFYQARDIHAAFAKKPELRDQFEPRILEGEIGLGACLAGIAGKQSTEGLELVKAEQLDLFEQGLRLFNIRMGYLGKFSEEDRPKAVSALVNTIAGFPPETREILADALRKAEKLAKAA